MTSTHFSLSRRDFVQTCALSTLALVCTRVLGGESGRPAAAGPASRRLPLDRDWRFGGKFDPAAITPTFDDTAFERVNLPHTVAKLSWQDWQPAMWDGQWIYRRHFRMPADCAGLRLFVQLDGAMRGALPYINGHALGEHLGGYLPFRREITEWVGQGDNVLAVVVDGRWRNVPPDGSPQGPKSIDYMEPAGLIRSVRIDAVPPIFIEDVFAKPVKVLTPERQINVTCALDAAAAASAPVEVAVELRDGSRVLARTSKKVRVGKAGAVPVSLTLAQLGDVALWDVDSPKLYDLVTTLAVGTQVIHDYRSRLGFREARFELDGFYLNGRRLQLFGLNRHELFPYVGFAMPPRVMRRDAEILRRELNCNVVRCSHYPQSPAFLDACDELGLLVWEEIPGWQYIGGAEWQDLAVRDVADMIRRDRNRPSVVIWGVRINESEQNPAFYQRTIAAARALDDSRPLSGAINGPLYSLKDWAGDVFAYNDYNHPQPSGLAQLRPPLEGVPYIITEAVGQIVGPGPAIDHKYRPAGDPEVQRRQAVYHAQVHDQAAANARYGGVIAWVGFDYGSLMNAHMGLKCPGVCDSFRLPKLGASYYRSQLDPKIKPVIYPNFHWDFGPQTPRGPGQDVAIFSNCSRLDVFVDGQRYASLKPDTTRYPHTKYPPFFLNLDLDGSRHPELRIDGFVDDRPVLSTSYSSNPTDDTFVLAVDDNQIAGDGIDMTRVVFRVADKFGATRAYAEGDVRFELSGPGEIVGDNPFSLAATGGAAAVWLRAKAGGTGIVRLTATHQRLGSRSVSVTIRAGSAPESGGI